MDYPIALPNCLVAQPYKLTKQGTTRLHNELIAFLKEVTPREDEIQMRNEIIDQISTAIRSLWRGVIVNVFGSFDSNTYLPMSDIDIVVQNHDPRLGSLHQLAAHLTNLQISKPGPQVLTKTKVPIIKMVHLRYNVDVDISMNTAFQGEKGTSFVKKLLANFEMLRPLVYIIKLNLVQNNLHDPYTGGLGSYALILLIVSFLQEYREKNAKKEADLGELLFRFFEYYGTIFNFTDYVVIVGKRNVTKVSMGWKNYDRPHLLSIQDPTDQTNDVGRGCFRMDVVASHFSDCYHVLKSLINTKQEGILNRIVRVSQISKFRNERSLYIQSMKQTQPNRTITHRDQQHNNQRYYKVRNEHNYEQRYEEYEDRYDAYEERFHQRSYEFKQNHQILRQNNQVYSQNNYISSPTYTQSYIQIDEKEEASKKRKNSFTTPNTQKKARYNPYELY